MDGNASARSRLYRIPSLGKIELRLRFGLFSLLSLSPLFLSCFPSAITSVCMHARKRGLYVGSIRVFLPLPWISRGRRRRRRRRRDAARMWPRSSGKRTSDGETKDERIWHERCNKEMRISLSFLFLSLSFSPSPFFLFICRYRTIRFLQPSRPFLSSTPARLVDSRRRGAPSNTESMSVL